MCVCKGSRSGRGFNEILSDSDTQTREDVLKFLMVIWSCKVRKVFVSVVVAALQVGLAGEDAQLQPRWENASLSI